MYVSNQLIPQITDVNKNTIASITLMQILITTLDSLHKLFDQVQCCKILQFVHYLSHPLARRYARSNYNFTTFFTPMHPSFLRIISFFIPNCCVAKVFPVVFTEQFVIKVFKFAHTVPPVDYCSKFCYTPIAVTSLQEQMV